MIVFVLLVLGSPQPRAPVRLWAAVRLSAAERYEGGAHMRAAAYVDKLLKRAKAADLSVEQPMPGELVINRKTARALGLTILPFLLFQAD